MNELCQFSIGLSFAVAVTILALYVVNVSWLVCFVVFFFFGYQIQMFCLISLLLVSTLLPPVLCRLLTRYSPRSVVASFIPLVFVCGWRRTMWIQRTGLKRSCLLSLLFKKEQFLQFCSSDQILLSYCPSLQSLLFKSSLPFRAIAVRLYPWLGIFLCVYILFWSRSTISCKLST